MATTGTEAGAGAGGATAAAGGATAGKTTAGAIATAGAAATGGSGRGAGDGRGAMGATAAAEAASPQGDAWPVSTRADPLEPKTKVLERLLLLAGLSAETGTGAGGGALIEGVFARGGTDEV